MRFMLPESAKNYFSNIMRREGSHTSDEKNKFKWLSLLVSQGQDLKIGQLS